MVVPERKHYDKALPDQLITLKYSFESSLGPTENYRYKQSVFCKIMLQDETGKDLETIGHLFIDRLLFGAGINNGWGHFEIFDTEQYLMDLGSLIWDFERNDYVEPLLEFFEYDLNEVDLLYIHTVEVLPAYRGMQIGEHVIKDAANFFEAGCSLIVTDCLPLQHTGWLVTDKTWRRKMKYSLFEKDKVRAKQKVVNYLQRTGFYYLPDVSEDHMFLCPARRNPNFDYIELD